MGKKIDERIPQNSGVGTTIKEFVALQSPWNKLISYQEAMHYISRFESVLSAAVIQALRRDDCGCEAGGLACAAAGIAAAPENNEQEGE